MYSLFVISFNAQGCCQAQLPVAMRPLVETKINPDLHDQLAKEVAMGTTLNKLGELGYKIVAVTPHEFTTGHVRILSYLLITTKS